MSEELKSRSSTGLDENIAGMLCYLFGPITGFVFYMLEKDSRFVRFHAVQSIATFLPVWIGYAVLMLVLGWIPFIGWLVRLIASVAIGLLALFMMWRAYQGDRFKLPFAGDIAERASLQN